MKFIENIKRIYEYGKELEIYLDMDRTIIELIFDIKKVPIKPVINQLEKIHRLYPNIKIKILSFSRNNDMTKE